MSKIDNIDLVAATLAASVISKIDYTKGKEDGFGNSDLISYNAVKVFKDIYNEINNFSNGVK